LFKKKLKRICRYESMCNQQQMPIVSDEEFILIQSTDVEEPFETIKKTYISEPFWGKVVNKN